MRSASCRVAKPASPASTVTGVAAGVHRAQRRGAEQLLVAAAGAELSGDPPGREVIGERELGVLGRDGEVADRALARQDVAEADAVVEDAELHPERAPRGDLLAQVDGQLVVAVADRPVLAPHRAPDRVVATARGAADRQAGGERRGVREVEAERRVGEQRGAVVRDAVDGLPSSSSPNATSMLRSGDDTVNASRSAASAVGASAASGVATSATASERQALRPMSAYLPRICDTRPLATFFSGSSFATFF